MAIHLLVQDRKVLADRVGIQHIHFIIVQRAQDVRLRDADPETVVLRDSTLRFARPVVEERKAGGAASARQQLPESRFQLLQVQVLVRDQALAQRARLVGTIVPGEVAQELQHVTVLSRKTIDFAEVEHHFSIVFLC